MTDSIYARSIKVAGGDLTVSTTLDGRVRLEGRRSISFLSLEEAELLLTILGEYLRMRRMVAAEKGDA